MTLSKSDITVGLVAIARTTFDIDLAHQLVDQAKNTLIDAGITISGSVAFVSELDEAQAVARSIAVAPPDLLILLQATFADNTIAVRLAENAISPVLLWGAPEPLSGGRLRLNSLCGINLAAHAFKQRSIAYDYIYGPPDDPSVIERIRIQASAGRISRILRGARVGCVGRHPVGFDPCDYNEKALKAHFGIEIMPITLDTIFELVRQTKPEAVDPVLEALEKRIGGLEALDQAAVRQTLASYLALRRIASDNNLCGLGVQCWPQFFTELKCAACGAMSMLSDELIPCSCEADINGTITQLILQTLSKEPTFGSDLVAVDIDENTAVLWHCGLAPLSMAGTSSAPRAAIHSNRKMPLLMEFALKPGEITIARLSQSGENYRLVIGSANVLDKPKSFSGTSGVVRFNRSVEDILDTIMSEGLEHHYSMTYGNFARELHTFAEQQGLEVVTL